MTCRPYKSLRSELGRLHIVIFVLICLICAIPTMAQSPQTPIIIGSADTNESISATDVVAWFRSGEQPREVSLTRMRTLMQQGISSGLSEPQVDARVAAGTADLLHIDLQNVDVNLNTAQKVLFRNAVGASDALEIFRGTYNNAVTYRRGDIVQQNFRFWIAITTSGTNHANNTAPSVENHNAWRPIDGQFRTHTPGNATTPYLRGDHLFVDGDLWFCRVDGNYTKNQILGGPAASPPTWEQLSGESGSGGLATVASDGTLTGDGSSGSPLGVANEFTSADELKLNGIDPGAKDDQTASEIRTLLQSLSGNNRLAYSALSGTPTIPTIDNAAVSAAVFGTPGNDQIPKWDLTNSRLAWADDAVGAAGSGEANVQANWTVTDTASDAYILNKPSVLSSAQVQALINAAGHLTSVAEGNLASALRTKINDSISHGTFDSSANTLTLWENDGGANTGIDLSSLAGGDAAVATATVTQVGTLTNSFHNTARAITLDSSWQDYTKLLWIWRKASGGTVVSAEPFVYEIQQFTSGRTYRFGVEQNDRLDITSVDMTTNVIGFLLTNANFASSTDVLTVYGVSYGGLRGVPGQDGMDGSGGTVIHFPDADGNLPDPALSANQGALAVSGNALLQSRQVVTPGHTRSVTFTGYGRTGAGIGPEELLFAGSFDNPPPIGNYSNGTILWDRGSQIWLKKTSGGSTIWAGFSGPVGFVQGGVFQTEVEGGNHVHAVNDVVIYGQPQNAWVVTAYTAAQASHMSWQWAVVGVPRSEIARLDGEVTDAQHGGSDSTWRGTHSNSATYTRGQMVRDGSDLYQLVSASSTGDDPFQNPNIWAQLNGNLRWRGVASSTAVRYYPGDVVEAGDNAYLCHTAAVSQTATTIPTNSSFWNISDSGGGGLDTAAVDARIRTWARSDETFDNTDIPVDKIIWAREFAIAGAGTKWERGQIVQYTDGVVGKFFLVRNDHQQAINDLPTTEDDFSEIQFVGEGDSSATATDQAEMGNTTIEYTAIVSVDITLPTGTSGTVAVWAALSMRDARMRIANGTNYSNVVQSSAERTVVNFHVYTGLSSGTHTIAIECQLVNQSQLWRGAELLALEI